MQCLITNCNHDKSRRMRMTNRTCWDLWQICPCCATVLVEMNVIKYKTQNPKRCINMITKELHVEPEPNYAEIIRIQEKKKYNQKRKTESL